MPALAVSDSERLYATRALVILKRNIHALLMHRKESQVALARHVRHSKAWINKFLNDPTDKTEIRIGDIDRIASFFGLEPYQLFQPGISRLTERRIGLDRRASLERRIGTSGRQLAGLRTELNKLPSIASSHGPPLASRSSAAAPAKVRRILERAVAEIFAPDAPPEATETGAHRAKLSQRRRTVRGSSAQKA